LDKELSDIYNKKKLISTTDALAVILKFLGSQGQMLNIVGVSDFAKQNGVNVQRFNTLAEFLIPRQLAAAMGIVGGRKFNDALETKTGILSSPGKYKDVDEAIGFLDIRVLLGINSLWSAAVANVTAGGINELLTDLDFSPSSKLKIPLASASVSPGVRFGLFKRVRPFYLPSGGLLGDALSLATSNLDKSSVFSSYFNLPQTAIPADRIVSADAGTNWQDVINFIEIMPDQALLGKVGSAPSQLKLVNSVYNDAGYALSGFKPIIMHTTYLPANAYGGFDLNSMRDWLKAASNWYFDSHKMLNGGVVFAGISEYIQVGSNILIPTSTLASASFVSGAVLSFLNKGLENYILGHVETVSHNFSVQDNGARIFYTSISYSRGIIVDDKAKTTSKDSYGVDNKTPQLSSKVNQNTVTT